MLTIALLLAFLMLFALVLAPAGWSDVLSSARNELVFAERNRDYGAYTLRREHHRTMFLAVLFGIGGLATLLLVPRLLADAPAAQPPLPPHDTGGVIFDVTPPAPPAPPSPKPPRPRTAPAVASGFTAVDTTTAVVDTTTAPTGPVDLGPVDTTTVGTPPGGAGGTTGGGTVIDSSAVTYADVAPEYPGGMDGLYRDIGRYIRYPEIDRVTGRQGQVKLVFVVGMDGRVSDIRVMRGVSPTIDAEAVRVFGQLKRWKPGSFAGKPVTTRYSIPIKFTLQ